MRAEEIERVKELLPTELGSAEIRERIARDILQRSIFSARMADAHYLKRLRDVCVQILAGEINFSTARADLGSLLQQMGFSPLREGEDGAPVIDNSLANPASERRLQLILDTQTQMAASVALLNNQGPDQIYFRPAWELVRYEPRRAPRADWRERWNAAGDAVGWEGALTARGATGDRMIALKTSPIWQALGDGAGGYTDTLGNPYPPFAYSSGMNWMDVDRDECIRLGLISGLRGTEAANQDGDANQDGLRPASLAVDGAEIQEAIARYGFPDIGFGLGLEGVDA